MPITSICRLAPPVLFVRSPQDYRQPVAANQRADFRRAERTPHLANPKSKIENPKSTDYTRAMHEPVVRLALFSDPVFEQHETGRHPECADRLRAIRQRLAKSGIVGQTVKGTLRSATDEE